MAKWRGRPEVLVRLGLEKKSRVAFAKRLTKALSQSLKGDTLGAASHIFVICDPHPSADEVRCLAGAPSADLHYRSSRNSC